ncbi:MAG: dTDP-4-dehydrorhamnose reductase [Candidatus Omnitrophica bacterium]|nr:dTDP-4-dehydrorhamnose reductase [Candidatus Omnitrophota bacterium]
MKILITGISGMLGRALWKTLQGSNEIVGLDIRDTPLKFEKYITKPSLEKLNITNQEEISKIIDRRKPNIVIHTAAYTDVDGCEREPEKANKVNALGTENVARACKAGNCLLIYISTDFVFDGEKKSAYLESDPPEPINVYGESKLAGEKLVQSLLKRHIIIRSSWLFGKGGKNFVDTILEKAKTANELKVVDDQFGSPTYAGDLAQAIADLIAMPDETEGIYHITNSGSCSWHQFARAIKELAGLDAKVVAVSSAEYRSPAQRPAMSTLDNRRYQELSGGRNLRPWKEALQEYLSGQN